MGCSSVRHRSLRGTCRQARSQRKSQPVTALPSGQGGWQQKLRSQVQAPARKVSVVWFTPTPTTPPQRQPVLPRPAPIVTDSLDALHLLLSQPALLVEGHVLLAAVQDHLVAPSILQVTRQSQEGAGRDSQSGRQPGTACGQIPAAGLLSRCCITTRCHPAPRQSRACAAVMSASMTRSPRRWPR